MTGQGNISWTGSVNSEIKTFIKSEDHTRPGSARLALKIPNVLKIFWQKSILLVHKISLTLKAPITTAADDKLFDAFTNFRQK